MNFIENESAEKLRGSYFTPPDIAAFLTRWVLEAKPKRLLEPSCGDGAFFEAVAKLKPRGLREVVGCEINPDDAARARLRAKKLPKVSVEVQTGDFLEWALKQLSLPPDFDAALGNPPFVRYQYLDPAQQERAALLFEAFELPFTRHTNAWVPFVIASIARLRPGGRLGMVVPAELLHVLHAQSLRQFLLTHCSRVLIVDPDSLMFDGILQGVVLLLAERHGNSKAGRGDLSIVRARDQRFLQSAEPDSIFAAAPRVPGDSLRGKWMPALLTESERSLFADVSSRPSFRVFKDVASVDVGIVTGANKFFLVSDEIVDRHGLHEFSHPMFGRSEHVAGVIYDTADHGENRRLGLPTNFIWFDGRAKSELPKPVQSYIRLGEAQGLHRRFKCRVRTPWYAVPSVYATPVGMLKRCHDIPRLVLNRMEAFTTDTSYRIKPKGDVETETLVGSFVNSLTALSAELEGRHYGGGVLELVPSEIERLVVPIASPSSKATLAALDKDVRRGVPAAKLLVAQDQRVLRPLGVSRSESEQLFAAWTRIKERRQRVPIDEAPSQAISRKKGSLAPGTGAKRETVRPVTSTS